MENFIDRMGYCSYFLHQNIVKNKSRVSGSVSRKKAKTFQNDAIPNKLFSVDPKTLSFKFGNNIFIGFEMPL